MSTNGSTTKEKMEELEETISRLTSHKGVEAVMILNRKGDIVISTGAAGVAAAATTEGEGEHSNTLPTQAKFIKLLYEAAVNYIKCLDPEDPISFVQVRSKQHQVMLAPHGDYMLAVLQDPLVDHPSAI